LVVKKGLLFVGYEIALTLAERSLATLPRFILKRIYTKSRLDKEIKIDTRPTNPLIFSLGSYVPKLNAWFIITNFSNLILRLDDFCAEVWVGQPLAIATCLDKPEINRKETQSIYTESFLSETQVSRLREEKQKGNTLATIYVRAYFESKIGVLEFKPTFENRPVIIQ